MKKICIVNLLSYFQKGEWGTFLCEMERAKKKKEKKKSCSSRVVFMIIQVPTERW